MISAKTVRYIKFGRGGGWVDASLDRGELHFGHARISHELAAGGDREAIKQARIEQGRDPRAAAEDAREIVDFYHLGADCLWITFARDHLWWTFAKPGVTWLGSGKDHGERVRQSIGGWRNTDVNGKPLKANLLSTKLTKIANYRRTICAVDVEEYLLRRINGVEEPLIAKSVEARDALIACVTDAIASLHWADFETLVDVIFARSGWHRTSALGGTQKLIDIVLEQPTTNERAAVQVKSAATQRTLDQYVSLIDEDGTFSRLFFVCHSPRGNLEAPIERNDIHVWCTREIAATVLRLGLVDWIIEKIA
jgi:hypothetical protein